MKKYIGIFLLFYCLSPSFSQSSTCNNALPFCTGSTYTFPASTNTPAPSGAYFDCLWTQPNPAFYYCEIDQPGNMTISISSTPYSDIDFICWGPFTNPNTMCNNLNVICYVYYWKKMICNVTLLMIWYIQFLP